MIIIRKVSRVKGEEILAFFVKFTNSKLRRLTICKKIVQLNYSLCNQKNKGNPKGLPLFFWFKIVIG
jgi:hypothetical protein